MKKIAAGVFIVLIFFVIVVVVRGLEVRTPEKQNQQLTKSSEPCPSPFVFRMPVDMGKVTSIHYPGQVRGGDYKPHGGFRFDNSLPHEIVLTVPYDAQVIDGSRYVEGAGEIQYMFDFAHPCGIRYRFDHLLTLTPKFQEIADKFPLPKESDSRTTIVNPPVAVKQGEVIAMAVGMTKNGSSKNGTNTGVDWGVYDYRQKNESSKNLDWTAKHPHEIEQYAVCWFDWITAEDRKIVLSLPSSDTQSGKASDYCE